MTTQKSSDPPRNSQAAPPASQHSAAAERARILRRMREIADFECGCAEDRKLTLENADQIELEGGGIESPAATRDAPGAPVALPTDPLLLAHLALAQVGAIKGGSSRELHHAAVRAVDAALGRRADPNSPHARVAHFATVATSEFPADQVFVCDWMEAAMKVCRLLVEDADAVPPRAGAIAFISPSELSQLHRGRTAMIGPAGAPEDTPVFLATSLDAKG